MELSRSYKVIPLKTWRRRELFQSFLAFDSPCFSVSFEPEILPLKKFAEERGESFFLRTLFEIARAYNSVPEMRRRFLNEDAIAEYDVVHPSTPLMTADGENYCQTTLPFRETFKEFAAIAEPIIEAVRRGNASGQVIENDLPNCFCASCVPWFCAAGYAPASYSRNQDIHVLTWFKMTAAGTVLVSNRFNHCFTDGIHVGRFFNAIARNFREPLAE